MPYYQGDFYQGDYYEGDPGFFGGLARLAIPGLRRQAAGVGRIIRGAVGRVFGTPAAAGAATTGVLMRLPGGKIIQRAGTAAAGVIVKHPVLSAAGAAGTIGVLAGARARGPGAVLEPAMRGFHLSKRTGAMVRNRRMRVTNPRALRRAIRRATGFARLARRVLHFTSPRAPRGRAVFKFKRRKK